MYDIYQLRSTKCLRSRERDSAILYRAHYTDGKYEADDVIIKVLYY